MRLFTPPSNTLYVPDFLSTNFKVYDNFPLASPSFCIWVRLPQVSLRLLQGRLGDKNPKSASDPTFTAWKNATMSKNPLGKCLEGLNCVIYKLQVKDLFCIILTLSSLLGGEIAFLSNLRCFAEGSLIELGSHEPVPWKWHAVLTQTCMS